MAVTSLKRKKLKNRVVSKRRTHNIKELTARPPIKKVDVEEIKATFTNTDKPAKKAAKAKEASAEKETSTDQE